MHKFTVLINGDLQTFYRFEDIPENFDNLIEFIPEIPDPPHTLAQHLEMDKWNEKLQELILKENKKYASSDENRRC